MKYKGYQRSCIPDRKHPWCKACTTLWNSLPNQIPNNTLMHTTNNWKEKNMLNILLGIYYRNLRSHNIEKHIWYRLLHLNRSCSSLNTLSSGLPIRNALWNNSRRSCWYCMNYQTHMCLNQVYSLQSNQCKNREHSLYKYSKGNCKLAHNYHHSAHSHNHKPHRNLLSISDNYLHISHTPHPSLQTHQHMLSMWWYHHCGNLYNLPNMACTNAPIKYTPTHMQNTH